MLLDNKWAGLSRVRVGLQLMEGRKMPLKIKAKDTSFKKLRLRLITVEAFVAA